MKSAFWRTMAVLAIVAMPTMAAANDATIGSEAAYTSMGQTTLNNTTGLFNAWPHLVTQYGSGAEIVSQNLVPPVGGGGKGRVWWEAYDELWLNLNVGRGDYGYQAAGFLWGGFLPMGFPGLSALGNTTPQNALNNPWVNLGIAKPTGNGGAWAANFYFGSDSNEDAVADVKNSSTAFGGLFSWGNGDGLHLSAEATLQSETDETSDPADDGSFLNFSVNARKDADLYIYQGSFFFGTGSGQGEDDAELDQSALGFLASAGRFLKNEVDGQTSIEFVGSFFSTTDDVNGNEDKSSYITLPGVRVAAWEKISDRFGLMGAITGGYVMEGGETNDGTDPDPDTDTTDAGFSYDWTAGLFAQFTDNVRVDFQFNKPALGKVLSLGNDDTMVMYIGATVGLN